MRLAALSVLVGVGGDDLLVGEPGDLDRDVLLGGEHHLEPGLLLLGEQPEPGPQGAPDAVERVPAAAAVSEGVLLDALRHRSSLCPASATVWKGSITVTASGRASVVAFL